MKSRTASADFAGGRVRPQARRVALGATLIAFVIYLMACLIVDLIVVNHLYGSIDSRLALRLGILTKELPYGISKVHPNQNRLPSGSHEGDLDDAPILAWFVPRGAQSAQGLDVGSPALPVGDLQVSQPTDAHFGAGSFRLEGTAVPNGRIVVATSTRNVVSVRATLLLIEGVLAPIILFSLFVAATVIGRRAAMPIERARLHQLEFTADASHELRTPLSVIEAEVGLALSSERPASAYRLALERVADESKRLRGIVDDLLWLARLDSLPAAPPHDAIDLASLTKTCAERFGSLAARHELSVSLTETGEFPPIVLAPADWLDRLVSVLLDNACRYTNAGGRVEVSVSSTDDRVMLIVDDSGSGIAEEERELVVQRFHRASIVPGGAGLGLSIANAVVKATSGEWSVTTAPLGGARIKASWPRFRADGGHEMFGKGHNDLAPSALNASRGPGRVPPPPEV